MVVAHNNKTTKKAKTMDVLDEEGALPLPNIMPKKLESASPPVLGLVLLMLVPPPFGMLAESLYS